MNLDSTIPQMIMGIKPEFQGVGIERIRLLPLNALELEFMIAWQAINDDRPGQKSTLESLLDRTQQLGLFGFGSGTASKRDWEVAGTVIQWLGTTVGRGFLAKVLRTPAAATFLRADLGHLVIENITLGLDDSPW